MAFGNPSGGRFAIASKDGWLYALTDGGGGFFISPEAEIRQKKERKVFTHIEEPCELIYTWAKRETAERVALLGASIFDKWAVVELKEKKR